MVEKCPCQTYVKSCCACVSMHCDECHGHSKFVQGRFCSNCGRPLKAELTPLYVPKSEVEKLKNELVVWKQDRFNLYQRLKLYEMTRQKVAREIFEELARKSTYVFPTMLYTIAKRDVDELKKKYTEEKE